jgi:transposase-like protein
MITAAMRTEMRRLVLVEGWRIETVARRYGVHHSVVRRALRDDAGERPAPTSVQALRSGGRVDHRSVCFPIVAPRTSSNRSRGAARPSRGATVPIPRSETIALDAIVSPRFPKIVSTSRAQVAKPGPLTLSTRREVSRRHVRQRHFSDLVPGAPVISVEVVPNEPGGDTTTATSSSSTAQATETGSTSRKSPPPAAPTRRRPRPRSPSRSSPHPQYPVVLVGARSDDFLDRDQHRAPTPRRSGESSPLR